MNPKTEQKIRSMSISEIRKFLAGGILGTDHSYDTRDYDGANAILQEKIDQREQDLAERNLRSTFNLVCATWGLVLVTFLLVLVAFFRK